MDNKLKAKITATIQKDQALADIIKNRTYTADIEQEYFINEFGETVYLPKEKFSEYFFLVKSSNALLKANLKYRTSGKITQLNITFTKNTESDILEHLNNLGMPKATYIKNLIRADMKK